MADVLYVLGKESQYNNHEKIFTSASVVIHICRGDINIS